MYRLSTLSMFLILFACNKKNCDIDYGYEFIVPAQFTPKQDTFKVGDTIYFVSEFDDLVREKNTGQSYELKDFNFYPTTAIRKIDQLPTLSALDNFQIIMDSAFDYSLQYFSSGDVVLNGRYAYSSGKYKLKFSLIPNIKGLYQFSHNSTLQSENGGNQTFKNKCESEQVREILVYLNEGYDNNIELLKNGVDTAFNNRVLNDPQEKFYEEGSYVFYVVE